MIIAIGSDHRGFTHKNAIKEYLRWRAVTRWIDCGCHSAESADYPDARPGRGAAMAAKRRSRRRGPDLRLGHRHEHRRQQGARRARLALLRCRGWRGPPGSTTTATCSASAATASIRRGGRVAEAWLGAEFEGGRHARRVDKIIAYEAHPHETGVGAMYDQVRNIDPEIADVLDAELSRQREQLEMIASENFTSRAVMETMGSTLTNKYAEGYPGQALLRRLRARGRGRDPGQAAGHGTVRGRAGQRAASQWLHGQHDGLPGLS